ncbi:MAG TPA: hypothetical protein VHO24_07695, partial [Opitutaceae bacterium]|nr:hypothetical protein [Opitutaceae bacterium]
MPVSRIRGIRQSLLGGLGAALGVLVFVAVAGCDAGAAAGNSAQKPQARYATGKITFEDGSPITGEVEDYLFSIDGVSEAGEKVSYVPVVKNGAYKQKLVAGQFRFSRAKIKVKFG